MTTRRVALVTGGNRGIGLEVCFQLAKAGCQVLLGARSQEKGQKAVEELKARGVEVEFFGIDTSVPASIESAYRKIAERPGRLDILVNNAGVFLDPHDDASAFSTSTATIQKTLETNTFGPFLMCQKFLPLMIKQGGGRVINVSSGMGQLSQMEGGYTAYRISKASLNAVTRIFSAEAKHPNVFVNSVCPGWVKTDMGGPNAHRTVDKGAETIVWLATSPEATTKGGFFRDKEQIPW